MSLTDLQCCLCSLSTEHRSMTTLSQCEPLVAMSVAMM